MTDKETIQRMRWVTPTARQRRSAYELTQFAAAIASIASAVPTVLNYLAHHLK